MSGFTKLSASIITSSIWQEDHATRLVWITMLAMANPQGVVEASIPGLANIANVEVEECEQAIRKLLEPDVYSRTAEHEGRRIEAIEGGWRILNYEKYRNEGGPFSLSADEQPTKIYFVQCGDKIKIGRSKNPWARLDALKTSMPEEPTLIGYYEAFVADERDLRLKWDHLHVNREWFHLTDELADDIERLTGNRPVATTALPVATGSYGSTTVATTTQKSEDRSQKQKQIIAQAALACANSSAFAQFWELYPKKRGKKDAEKAWRKLNPDDALLKTILDAVAFWKQTKEWTKDNGTYVPLPATWLRGERWTDERPLPSEEEKARAKWKAEFLAQGDDDD